MHPTSPVDRPQPLHSSTDQQQSHDQHLNRSMEIADDSLALFRSYSMPIQISSTGSDDQGPLDQAEEEDTNQDEDDEDYDELLITPTSQLHLHNPTRYASSYQSAGQRLLSCSLPPSLNRRKTNDIHHEYPLHELLQLTQPMREGVISRERLLPSSRMKQVGIGGRGRRGISSQRNPGSPSAGSTTGVDSTSSPTKPDQPPWSPDSSCSPLLSTINLGSSISSSTNPILAPHQQFANPTPLVRPTPIVAWQRPQA